jgi:3-hydroxyisobutyrate dehydrogenase
MARIGFIGLGNMGLPMAANLAKAGHGVEGFDMAPGQNAKARASGIGIAPSAAAAAREKDFVVTMLPDGRAALEVLRQVLETARPGTVIIDSSTIDVASAREAHALAQGDGKMMIDAPVSGGVGGAEAATLTFMAGGAAEAFEKARPILEAMGKRTVHCGGPGAGQAAKICNNMLLGISMIGTCEAFGLAKKLGLSQQALFDVVSTSSGSCWSVNTYCPVPGVGPKTPADNDYRPGFAAALMLKDLALSQQAAEESGMSTPLGQHAAALYSEFVEAGNAATDFSGIIRQLEAAGRD